MMRLTVFLALAACSTSTEVPGDTGGDAGAAVDAFPEDVGRDVPLDRPDVGAEDAGAQDAPADIGTDARDASPRPRLLLIHWPFGFTDAVAQASDEGFELGPGLSPVPTEGMALITNLRASPPEPIMNTHFDVPPSLWTGGAGRDDERARGAFALHPSLDFLVAAANGQRTLNTRTGTIRIDPLSWTESGPSEDLSVEEAAVRAPCAEYPAPIPGRTYVSGMLDEASDLLGYAISAFEGGCRSEISIHVGSRAVRVEETGESLLQASHEIMEEGFDAVNFRFAEWLGASLEELRTRGILDDTLVVLTTEIGGRPLWHDFMRMPVMMWSNAPGFVPGWIDGEGRPVRDWLHTVGLYLGVDAPFSAGDAEPGRVIEGLFTSFD